MWVMSSSSWISFGKRERKLLSPLKLSDTINTTGRLLVLTKHLWDTDIDQENVLMRSSNEASVNFMRPTNFIPSLY